MNDKITIITVCYNSVHTIGKTFESLLHQSDRDFSYIVVDGASNDGTVEKIKEYEKLFRRVGVEFQWTSEPDSGIYNAMNKGIKKAKGDYIGILNSDDTYEYNTIEIIKSYIRKIPTVDVFHGLMRYIDGDSLTMVHGLNSDRLNSGMIEHPTCFVKKEVYDYFGFFSEDYKYVSDYEFMLRLKKAGCKFYLIEEILANYNENGAGNCHESRVEVIKLKREYQIYGKITFLAKLLKTTIIDALRKKS